MDISSFNRASINIFRQEFLSLVRSAEPDAVRERGQGPGDESGSQMLLNCQIVILASIQDQEHL